MGNGLFIVSRELLELRFRASEPEAVVARIDGPGVVYRRRPANPGRLPVPCAGAPRFLEVA